MIGKAIRPIRIEGDVAYVLLTKGYEAIIDADNAETVGLYNWYALENRNSVYGVRRYVVDGEKYTSHMHRIIINAPCDMQVDHIDGNGLNNRKSNLRIATNSQNQHNARMRSDNTSGYKGVSFHKPSGLWQARLSVGGVCKSLGYFGCSVDAYDAYCIGVKNYHAEFGRTS
jgi:hypothetical protein